MDPTARPDVRRAYTSTVVSWIPLTLVLAVAVVAATTMLATGLAWWSALVLVAVLAVVGAQVSVARLSIAQGRLVARLGVLAIERIDVTRIEEPEAVQLSWRQALGIGMPFGFWVKMTISPGPALLLRADRVRLRISTPHPDEAIAAILAEQAAATVHDAAASEGRRWFGPKRVGVGLRPQTWQGWALTLGAVLAVVVVLALVGR